MSNSIKKVLVQSTVILKLVRDIRKRKENNRMMRLNRKYRRAIASLYDKNELDNRIARVDAAMNEPEQATYYIVSQSNETVGIFGYINVFLPHIAFAVSKGWIPVIDMESHRYIYTPDDEVKNVWEMFFNQPCGVGLKDLKGKKTIRCNEDLWYRWMPNTCPLMKDDDISLWAALYHRFVSPNPRAECYMQKELDEILKEPKKTVGVIYRGTTYTKGLAKGHPIQPTMKMLADRVEIIMSNNGCEWIYLASDEKSIVNYFNERFPGKILINKRVYYDEVDGIDYSKYNMDGTDITGKLFERLDNHYLIGIEYISSMNLVANCSCLVAGACGGTTAVLYMNGGRYRYKYIFELGKYGYDPVPED